MISVSQGKYLSLEEARKMEQLERFAKEHPSEGNEKQFNALFEQMATKTPVRAE